MTDEPLDISRYESGTFIFSGPDDEQSIIDAKQYVADNKIDKNMVKLIRHTVFFENGESEKMIAIVVK